MKINGKLIAREILADLKERITSDLSLTAILVGDDPGLKKFVELKRKAAEDMGIHVNFYTLPENISQRELEDKITEINQTRDQGIILELPLPKNLNALKAVNLISPEKDVDVLSSKAQEKFYNNESKILPPAVEAVKIVFEKFNIDLKGKKAAVFGQGVLVGKPISHWLESQGVSVHRIDETTPNPEQYSREAEVLVSGVGKPHFISSDMIKDGAIVIDFGYTSKDSGMAGDIEPSAAQKAALFTPVPGGMGPIVVAAVLKNLIDLWE